ncbi:acyl carrier protein [Streptomyces sp. NPDC002125]
MKPDRDSIAGEVKRVVIAERGLALQPSELADGEPLDGELLKISSMALLGILTRLEDELSTGLPDDLFAGRSYKTVHDLIVLACDGAEEAGSR